ncbi:MAG: hypothetical protein ABTQ29_05395 [Siculibacillus sp.]
MSDHAREGGRSARPVWANPRAGTEVGARERLLPRLIAIGPAEIADGSRAGRAKVLRLLTTALDGERRRGRGRHWSYRLDRHIGLVQALESERAAWLALFGVPWREPVRGAGGGEARDTA